MSKFYCVFCEAWHTSGEKFGPIQKDYELGLGGGATAPVYYILNDIQAEARSFVGDFWN